MAGSGSRSLKRGLITFIALVSIAFITILVWNGWSTHHARLREAEVSTSNMAKALAQHAQDTITGVDNVAAGLVESIERLPMGDEHSDSIHAFMRQREADLPVLNSLAVFDENGAWLTNSIGNPTNDRSNADREYFIFHRTHIERGPHIGPPVKSRLTGDWIIPLSRRLNHPDGSFAGVVLAAIDIGQFAAFYRDFDVGKSGTILLTTDTGTLLLRLPFDTSMIGRDVSSGQIHELYLSRGPYGTAMLASEVDGMRRLYSYRHLDSYPLLISTALSEHEIFRDWKIQTARLALGGLAVLAMLWILGLRLSRQIDAREQTRTELRMAKNELERSNGELAALALEDGLTGLANRRRFDAVLEIEFARASRDRTSLALIMIDVDNFKQYNDAYGHPAGDACLRRISEVFHRLPSRPGDLVARYGGEELAVILPATDEDGAIAMAQRIRLAVLALEITHLANKSGVVTISAGVSTVLPATGSASPEALVWAADKALYAAKAQGRNQVRQFPSALAAYETADEPDSRAG